MPLRLLCLHGWGTSIKILQSQLGPLMSDLRRDNTATFHFLEGECDSDPGPGIAGYFDGPYYSYYKFPRSFSDNDDSDVLDAYDQLYTVIEEEGPFDGILGFSHGGTLAAGFLIQHAERFPHDPPLVRCAIFINSLPPFRMNPGGKPVIDMGLDGYLSLPTVSIAGAQDSLLEYSRALHELCSPTSAWVVHSKGHDIPGDRTNVARMAAAIRKLAVLYNNLGAMTSSTFDAASYSVAMPYDYDIDNDKSMPIAIVGMGFRGPGDATNVERLWQMILDSREARTRIAQSRWNNDAFYHPDHSRHGTINVQDGHFLTEDVSLFDAPFFNMTSDEAASMDPQQRLLLEVTYEGLENAGISLPQITGTKTSCFVGSFNADYTDLLLRDPEAVSMYQCTNAGQSRAMTANRVSYFYDLKGLSVTVDTACSGSLVALHLACQSLRTGDATMAIAAGVNVVLSHEFMTTMSMMKFLSPDGRCYTFDDNANGYARGEAVGCLILKPLKDAIRDKDTIRAVIRGSGSNQDGRTPGITLPNGAAQEALIRDVYNTAGLDPRETEFVEAHGTGTQAGDPIETSALSRVFGPGRAPDTPLRIGSIKTNVGHLEGSSGVAGVMKAVFMLENRMFLPNRNFKTLNPRILLGEWKLKIQLEPEAWDSPGPHRVSVNSFGYGGSNAHIILEDAAGYLSRRGLNGLYRTFQLPFEIPNGTANHDSQSSRTRVFMISGFDETSCTKQAERLREYLLERESLTDDAFMNSLAFTLNEHRTRLPYKVAVTGDTASQVAGVLSSKVKVKRSTKKPTVGYVFTGQGAQSPGMGRELLDAYPVFRKSIENIDGYLKHIGAPFSVLDEIWTNKDPTRLSLPLHSQPLCSALQIALVDLLASWGIVPDSVTGHSSGEIASAYAVGALTMEDAMSIAYHRGVSASKIATEGLNKGGMLALGMSAEDIQPYLEMLFSGKAVVACVNSPSSVTISGDVSAIAELESLLSDKQVFSRRLAVDVAYHSHHMEQIAAQYLDSIAHIKPMEADNQAKSVSFFSSVTGTELPFSELGAEYWVRNLLGQVKFSDSLRTLCFETDQKQRNTGTKRPKRARKVSVDTLIEVGPHSAMSGAIKQIFKPDPKLSAAEIAYGSVLVRKQNAVSTALSVATMLAASSYPVDFQAFNNPTNDEPHLLVDLPPYAWNHSRSYWAESRISKVYRNRKFPHTDLLGVSDPVSCPFEPRWRNYIRVVEIPWLRDHKIQSNIVYPAAGYIAMAIEAASQHSSGASSNSVITGYLLRDVSIQSALVINETSAVEVLISLRESASDDPEKSYKFHIYSASDDNRWTQHCKGFVSVQYASPGYIEPRTKLTTNGYTSTTLDVARFYETLAAAGLDYGPTFANMTAARYLLHGCVAEITVPDTAAVMPMNYQHSHIIHPCTLDAIFHSIFPGLPGTLDGTLEPPIPVSIGEMYVSSDITTAPGSKLNVSTQVREQGEQDALASILASDAKTSGTAVFISDLRCRRLASDSPKSAAKETRIAYRIDWQVDPDLLSRDGALYILGDGCARLPVNKLLERCALHYIRQAIEALSDSEIPPTNQAIWRFFVDIAGKYKSMESDITLPQIQQVLKTSPTGELLVAVGENIPAILQGKVDAATLLHSSGLLEKRLYDCYDSAAVYLRAVGHKNPSMSVLQIGTGTGGAIQSQFQTLFLEGRDITPGFLKYKVTDADQAVLEDAAKSLSEYEGWIDFKTLDIEAESESQGFTSHHYDAIVVPHGIYAAKSKEQVLKNIHKLLKPGGHLVLIDPASRHDGLVESVIFGCLPGWPPGEWDQMLREAQFSGVNHLVEFNDTSLILSNPLRQTPSVTPAEVLIITEESDSVSLPHLRDMLSTIQLTAEITDLAHAKPTERLCIVLSDILTPSMTDADDATFETVKSIFLKSSGVLWVTRGGETLGPRDPDASIITGFARTARSESGVEPIVTLDLDARDVLSPERAAEVIFRLFQYRFFVNCSIHADTEYSETGGILSIPRVVEEPRLNKHIATALNPRILTDQLFYQHDRPLRAIVGNSNRADRVYFVDDSRASELPSDHVGIRVQAVGLIKDDTRVQPGEENVGMQCSGTVYAVGSAIQSFEIGDQVVCLGTGTNASVYHDRAEAFQKIQSGMSLDIAATLPVPFCTAFYVLHYLARVRPGDTVLINGAASVYGQAMVKVANQTGARVFAIVADEKQKTFLFFTAKIPADQILVRDVDDFTDRVEHTTGKDVDVVVDCNDYDRDVKLLANRANTYGRFIKLEGANSKDIRFSTLNKEAMFAVFSLETLRREKPEVLYDVFRQVMDLFRDGTLQGPPLLQSVNISGLNNVLDSFDPDSSHFTTITAAPDDLIRATRTKADLLLRPDASYMLVGGLGGIGRTTALWMADRGARTLIFVNRSGLSKESSKETVRVLEERGVRVIVYACDVSDSKQMQTMVSELAQQAPPIRGVIQAAMVLKDTHIEKMTPETYHTVLQPKYSGTWNLHRHLPSKSLDFFLLLSSISGIIGNATQAAYAAGSTFMDAFASYRSRILGLPTVSLDLGVITDVGYVAEHQGLAAAMEQQGFQGTDTPTLLALIEMAISQPIEFHQVITGLGEWKGSRKSLANFDAPLFARYRRLFMLDSVDADSDASTVDTLREDLAAVKTLDDATGVIYAALSAKIAAHLSLSAESIDPSSPISEYGVDSHVAVELRNWITEKMESTVPILEILASGSVGELAAKIGGKSKLVKLEE